MERKTKTTRLDVLAKSLKVNGYRDKASWEYDNIRSICYLLMHELHPEDVVYYVCQERMEFQPKTTKFNNKAKFIIALYLSE